MECHSSDQGQHADPTTVVRVVVGTSVLPLVTLLVVQDASAKSCMDSDRASYQYELPMNGSLLHAHACEGAHFLYLDRLRTGTEHMWKTNARDGLCCVCVVCVLRVHPQQTAPTRSGRSASPPTTQSSRRCSYGSGFGPTFAHSGRRPRAVARRRFDRCSGSFLMMSAPQISRTR